MTMFYLAHYGAFIVSFLAGYQLQRVKRVDVDYSKYLGPNYEKTYDQSGIYIVNHTTFYEVTLSMYLMGPMIALLGKKEVTVIPGIRQIAFAVGNILVGRDTKDS